jgi:hypothetical protein
MRLIRPITIDDTALTSSNAPENDYAAYVVVTTYGLGDRVIVVGSNIHYVYESLQAANTNHNPLTDSLTTPVWWLRVSYTNKWKMFDGYVTSQTAMAEEINVTIQTTGRIDSVTLLNLDAAEVQIIATDVIDGEFYNKTFNLVSNYGISSWYNWFFEPAVRQSDFSISDLPAYRNPSTQIILRNAGGTVLCGACVIGLSKELGATQYGLKLGIQDYSVKQQDVFGNYTILQRAFNNYTQAQVMVEAALVDQVQTILAGYRATPIVYVAADEYKSSIVYGFFKEFYTLVSYPSHSILTIELAGLT